MYYQGMNDKFSKISQMKWTEISIPIIWGKKVIQVIFMIEGVWGLEEKNKYNAQVSQQQCKLLHISFKILQKLKAIFEICK